MSLLADSSPPKIPGKKIFENGSFNSQSFPSNFKRPKLDVVRSFPVNFVASASVTAPSDTIHPQPKDVTNSTLDYRAIACRNTPSKIKCRKVDFVRDFPRNSSPFSSDVDAGESQQSSHMKAILAVPLRHVPAIDVKWEPKKSVASHGKDGDDDDDGLKVVDNDKGKVHSREQWERDLQKLTALIAEAKECINASGINYSTPIEEPKPLKDIVKQEKRVREKILAESVPMQNFGENLPQKRMKVEDRVSKLVHEQKASELEDEWKDNEEEVCVLSPAEWNSLQLSLKHKKVDSAKDSVETIETKPENMSESQGIEIVDLVDLCSVGLKCERKSERASDCGLIVTKFGEKHQEHSFIEEDESLEKLNIDDCNAIVKYSNMGSNAVINGNDEPKCYQNKKELINLMIVQHEQPEGCKVLEALKLFEEQYTKIWKEQKAEQSGNAHHFEAAVRLKAMGMWIFVDKPFGHIPGVEIGDEFRFRAELAVVGLHRQLISGIDYVVLDGKKFATSVVNSGRYENTAKTHDVLIYSGRGGNLMNANKAVDQKLEKGNLALVNSMEMGYPVRVTYKTKNPLASKTLGMRNDAHVYVYDGLYMVNKVRQDRDLQNGKLVYKFELHRMSGQPRTRQTNAKSRKSMMRQEVCVLDDVSQGKEHLPMRAMNGVDDDRPPPFTYTRNIVYPSWYRCIEPIGCNCIDGCSDSQKCPCVLKNSGEIPFNKYGAIIRAKPLVHECGPACKCPPSCMNRVSQHGPSYQLEIFKTKTRGWGVRSRNYILSGSFICEYVGEVLQEKEAEQRIGDDEYLFDICDDGFAIDACSFGNIGRFINHSCSPNLYAQEVLYGNDDARMPHIMFFATKKIPPLQELTYDYNYKMGRVCDVNGNIKMKGCYCGSRKCTGRMY